MATTPGILYVTMQPKPGLPTAQFHDWYNNEHGPNRLRLSWIPNGFRYRANDLKGAATGTKEFPEWMAIYDIDDMKLLLDPIYTRLRSKDGVQTQRERDTMAQIDVDRKFFDFVLEQKSSEFRRLEEVAAEGEGNSLVVVKSQIPPGLEIQDLEAWYREEHFPMLSKVPGWLRSRIFRTATIEGKNELEYLAVHDYKPINGLGGPEFLAATGTEWSKRIGASLGAGKKRRAYDLYYTFGPAARDLSSLSSPDVSPFTSNDGATKTIPGSRPVVESFVTTRDGVDLPYRLEGSTDPAAPLIVFSNSILTNWTIWDEALEAFFSVPANKKYRVLRYLTRGVSDNYGKIPINLDILARDIVDLLDAVRVPKAAAVIGVSLGGATTLNFALSYPDRLGAFISADTNAKTPPTNSKAWGERIAVAEKQNVTGKTGQPIVGDELAELTVRRWFSKESYDGGKREANVTKVKQQVTNNSLGGFKKSVEALFEYDLKSKLAESKVKGIFLVGAQDGVLPGTMKEMADLYGGGTQLAVIEGAGHLPMVEKPQEVAEVITKFLA